MEISPELNALLSSVSRSFYLSLRLLPAPVRAQFSLAYLLARASDSIADSATTDKAERLELLSEFSSALQGPVSATFFTEVAKLKVDHPGEQILLQRLAACVALLRQVGHEEQQLIREVLGHILRGQSLDLQRFPGVMPDRAALEEYTFLVAGSVGEFWSKMLALKMPHWSKLPAEEMIRLGRRYGQGLQLVNILRDVEADAALGREYLPGEGTLLERRRQCEPIAKEWLAAGTRYAQMLRGWRLRFTADLPWRLGVETLALLPEDRLQKVKVTRATLRKLCISCAWRALPFVS
jgi:farnesyl-diphosphate farnesyltransferase